MINLLQAAFHVFWNKNTELDRRIFSFTRHREDERQKAAGRAPTIKTRAFSPGLAQDSSLALLTMTPPASVPTARQAHSLDSASAGRCS